ncbi:hypothetical protein UQ13_10470, partial [Escherichia coli]
PDLRPESEGWERWPFGVRGPDGDYPVTVVEAKGFFNLASAPAVALNQPFGLFFSAWGVPEPVRFECMRTPPVPAGKDG